MWLIPLAVTIAAGIAGAAAYRWDHAGYESIDQGYLNVLHIMAALAVVEGAWLIWAVLT
jgi:hypothetical protein